MKRVSKWEWRVPKSHTGQPLLEWWAEQVAVVIILKVGKRAIKRRDQDTLYRMTALSQAGAAAEARDDS